MLAYKCLYDGKLCEKETPEFDENGKIIPPEEYKNPALYCPGDWKACMECDRNHTVGGTCRGIITRI